MMFKMPSPLSYTDLSPLTPAHCAPLPAATQDWKGDPPELKAGCLVWVRTLDLSPGHGTLWALPAYDTEQSPTGCLTHHHSWQHSRV